MSEEVDVLVVGAGPAGLVAGVELARRSSLRVKVIDAGGDIEDRASGRAKRERDIRVWGVGGAGLFSDGKLCLSLGVGGELGAILPDARRASLLARVAAHMGADCSYELAASPVGREAEASCAGLSFSYYPVHHIGSDHCAARVRVLRDSFLNAGGSLAADTELLNLQRHQDVFHASLRRDRRMRRVVARRVVLAMGKVAAEQQAHLCRELGAAVRPLPMYVGTRLETDRAVAAPLFRGVIDPKYKVFFEDGSRLKMHCATDGGAVLPLAYDGFLLAGGHASVDQRSARSSFGLLWNGLRVGNDAIERARDLMRRAAALAPGTLIAQRLIDCLHGKTSHASDVARTRPSTDAWAAGDLREVLPPEYFDRVADFVGRLARISPEIYSESTLLFGPAIEWWMNRIDTKEDLETEVPGLFVAGDGSGWSQGIVHAAATGLVVADAICQDEADSSDSANPTVVQPVALEVE